MTPKITVLTSLYNCINYLDFFFQHLERIENKEEIEVLLLHNAPKQEEMEVIQKYLPNIPCLVYHAIPEREGLYTTWNRGIHLAKGKYICIWNVDDIRTPQSLLLQAETLDSHPEAALTYGDIGYMYTYGNISNEMNVPKQFEKHRSAFFRSHQINCFPMWRKSIHDKIGYYDEQFKLVADFDFQIRVARCYKLAKTNATIGYYLEFVPTKLSYSPQSKQRREQNVIYMRYGIWDKFNLVYLFDSLKNYKIILPQAWNFPRQRRMTIYRFPLFFLSLYRQPRYFLAFIKHDVLKK